MDALGADAFASTQRNMRAGNGNTNPRHAYLRRPAVELTQDGYGWITARFQQAFDDHGKLDPLELDRLDWPDV
jgi:hypothetical protein